MLLDVVGELIERRVDRGLVGKRRRLRADALQPVVALAVVGEKPMDVAAGDPAVGAHRAVMLAVAES